MKSSITRGRTVGAVAVSAWLSTVGLLLLTMLEPDAMHWRGCMVLAGCGAVTSSMAWLIRWMMPNSSEAYEAGYRAAEHAAAQREVQRDYGSMILGGRTGTTSVIPIRPIKR